MTTKRVMYAPPVYTKKATKAFKAAAGKSFVRTKDILMDAGVERLFLTANEVLRIIKRGKIPPDDLKFFERDSSPLGYHEVSVEDLLQDLD